MLLRTTALADVEIDARAHRARVRAGARWADVIYRASLMGLAPAAGFSRTAGVVGDLLGDGMGWLARTHGVAARSVTAVEFVTADGEQARVDGDPPPGCAPRRQRGHRRRVALHPADDLYAGALFFSFDRADEVLHAWREWTATAPAEITSIARVMRFADRHDVPEMVRADVRTPWSRPPISARTRPRGAAGTAARPAPGAGHVLVRPARAARPPAHGFRAPGGPPGRRRHRRRAPPAPIDDLLAVAGPGSQSPLTTVELRHASGALETLERGFFTHAAGTPTDAASAAAIEAQLALVAGALAPYGAFPLNAPQA